MPKSLLRSLGHALSGLVHAWQTQRNFRIEAAVGVVALGMALWLQAGLAPVASMVGLVLALELVNTALETALDLVHPQPHPLVRIAKDTAAAAVLVASITAVLVGLAVLGPALVTKICRVC